MNWPTLDSLPSIPSCFLVRQRFGRPVARDVVSDVRRELAAVFPDGAIRPGAVLGVTVGSRGIVGIASIVKAAVDFLKERGARPFILPAMGSHGGAKAEGQRRLISHYGVTEEAMGVSIRDAMATRRIGTTDGGVAVHMAETALESDGVLVINRVKPHTDYKGIIESGLGKMCAIGLGKLEGARECHSHVFGQGLGAAIRDVAGAMLASGKILGGLGILENAYHETARIVGVSVAEFLEVEARLLEESRALVGRLPLDELDVLLCDRMGKNISGTGLDTNVIGRSVHGFVEGVPWQAGQPVIWRVVVRDLSDESEGNAVGLGMVDFAPERLFRRIDLRTTLINAMTARAPANARLPAILPTDRQAIGAALSTTPRREGGPLLAYVRDTLDLEHVMVSEACRPLVEGREDVEILSEPGPLAFDDDDGLISPFPVR